MYSIVSKAKQAEMFDIRRRVDDHGDGCDGVHQRICSLTELYEQADGGTPVVLVCWKCGHEAGLLDIEGALERAAYSLADEVQTVQRALNKVRIKNQTVVLQKLIADAEERDQPLEGDTIGYMLERNAHRFTATAKRLASMSVVE